MASQSKMAKSFFIAVSANLSQLMSVDALLKIKKRMQKDQKIKKAKIKKVKKGKVLKTESALEKFEKIAMDSSDYHNLHAIDSIRSRIKAEKLLLEARELAQSCMATGDLLGEIIEFLKSKKKLNGEDVAPLKELLGEPLAQKLVNLDDDMVHHVLEELMLHLMQSQTVTYFAQVKPVTSHEGLMERVTRAFRCRVTRASWSDFLDSLSPKQIKLPANLPALLDLDPRVHDQVLKGLVGNIIPASAGKSGRVRVTQVTLLESQCNPNSTVDTNSTVSVWQLTISYRVLAARRYSWKELEVLCKVVNPLDALAAKWPQLDERVGVFHVLTA